MLSAPVFAALITYSIGCTILLGFAIVWAVGNGKLWKRAIQRELTLERLLERRRRREQGLPQPRAANGRFTA